MKIIVSFNKNTIELQRNCCRTHYYSDITTIYLFFSSQKML